MIGVSAITQSDRAFIDKLRGGLILRVVLAHLGLSWFYLPYSSYIGVFFPALFFVSGIVTFYSFNRAFNTSHFLYKRLLRLYIPYLLITSSAFLLVWINKTPKIDVYSWVDWMLMNMNVENSPYPLGQVWFLRVLVLTTLYILPFFILSRRNVDALLIPVFLGILASSLEFFWSLGRWFSISFDELTALNLFQVFTNAGYFCFGAWLFASGRHTNLSINIGGFLSTLCIAIFMAIGFSVDMDLRSHSYNQDIYYMALGYAAIFGIIIFRSQLEYIFAFSWINIVLTFFSKHAFVIFLIHSFFIYGSEHWFGWRGLSNSLDILALKIIFVIGCSCLSAIPLSFITKKITIICIELSSSGDHKPHSNPRIFK